MASIHSISKSVYGIYFCKIRHVLYCIWTIACLLNPPDDENVMKTNDSKLLDFVVHEITMWRYSIMTNTAALWTTICNTDWGRHDFNMIKWKCIKISLQFRWANSNAVSMILCRRGFTWDRSEKPNFEMDWISIYCCLLLNPWRLVFCELCNLCFLVNSIWTILQKTTRTKSSCCCCNLLFFIKSWL